MNLYLRGHDYKYAIEQMMFTLFGSITPVYPQNPPQMGTNYFISTLLMDGTQATCTGELCYNGEIFHDQQMATVATDATAVVRDRAVTHALKQAFYSVAVQALGHSPVWGALSGVRPVKIPTKAMLRGDSRETARRELEEIYHVSPLRTQLALDCAEASVTLQKILKPEDISLYIGIPFCPSRCTYCSFVSASVGKTLKLVEPYLNALVDEIRKTGEVLRQTNRNIKTVYVGGGTPTTLSAPQLDRLLTAIETYLPIEKGAEFTVEAGRPDTITREKLETLRPHHVNRISINPQTMEPHVLAAMGRTHSPQDSIDRVHLAREIGELEINMDLIAGLPQDTVEGFCRSLVAVVALKPENITVHTLAMKKGSTLIKRGDALISPEDVAQMLEFAWATLRQAGYVPYYLYRQKYMSGGFENISWCQPNCVNRYNIIMMEELHSVLSLGAGGITKLVERDTGRILRLANPKYPHDYLSNIQKILSQKDSMLDFWNDGGL